MKAKELADMLMKHPDADVKIRADREVQYGDDTRGTECEKGDLVKEAVIWTGETIVIAIELPPFYEVNYAMRFKF